MAHNVVGGDQDGINCQLMPGEKMLWQGRPARGLLIRPIDGLLIPFSLMWGGFVLFWNVTVWMNGAPWFFRLWGLPFLAIGLHFVAGRFFVDAYFRGRIMYGVTDRRVLIVRMGPGGAIKSLDIDRLPVLELTERSDGSGSIRFGNGLSIFAGRAWGTWMASFDPTPQFFRIEKVRSVFSLIQRGGV